MVTSNFLEDSGAILECFRDYQRVSGLQLNMAKVVVVPLWIPQHQELH